MKGSGLVIDGKKVMVDGVNVVNFLDDTELVLADHCCSRRRHDVRFIVLHTTHGYPDHENPTPQRVRDEAASEEHCTAKKTIAYWRKPDARIGGAGVVVDADGTCYCLCDLATVAAYHCVGMNQISVGIEVVQQSDSSLFRRQLDVVVLLIEALQQHFELPRTAAMPYRGCRAEFDVDAKGNKSYCEGLGGVGVVGHRDCSGNRGSGDPGDFLMQAFVDAGWSIIA